MTSAEPSVVYALLRDGASWPEWSPLGSFELERAAEDEPEGLGAIRVFRTGWITNREEIVELVPTGGSSYAALRPRDTRAAAMSTSSPPTEGR